MAYNIPVPYYQQNYGNYGAYRGYGAYDPYGYAAAEIDDTNHAFDVKAKNMLTDMGDRGFGSSTRRYVVPGIVNRERDAALRSIYQRLQSQRPRSIPVPYYQPPQPDINSLLAQLNTIRPPEQSAATASVQQLAPPQAPAPMADQSRPTTAQAIAAINAQRAAASDTQDELRRRAMMVSLQDAMNSGGLEGEAQTRQALRLLTQFGYAQQRPAEVQGGMIRAAVGKVPYEYFANPAYEQGGGGATYSQPTYGKGNAYYTRLADIQRSRQKYMQSPSYLSSLARQGLPGFGG